LAVRESVEQSSADSERVLRAVLADAMKAYVSPPAPAVDSATNSTAVESIHAAGTTPSTAASTLPQGKILSGMSRRLSLFVF
uniref:Transcriptional regulator n=1 Tax=Schistocephalus solidus TaxID=70667 RepID=A0A183SCI9_SCHSO